MRTSEVPLILAPSANPLLAADRDAESLPSLPLPADPPHRLPGRLLAAVARFSETRLNLYAGLASDALLSGVLLAFGFRASMGPVAAISALIIGLMVFTFVEYAFHRWLFHAAVPLFSAGHAKHHQRPGGFDSLPFFLPPAILILVAWAMTTAFSVGTSLIFAGGLATGYTIYGVMHRALHLAHFKHRGWRKWAAFHHCHHHHPTKNFGVTSPLWDILLRTRYTRNRLRRRTVAANSPGSLPEAASTPGTSR